jgi:hypothetical protein
MSRSSAAGDDLEFSEGVFGEAASSFLEIPFHRQTLVEGERRCGAAALAMVLDSLGVSISQASIWGAIATEDDRGRKAARTSSLAREAILRGVPSLVVQLPDGWSSLSHLLSLGMRVIANHRPEASSRRGHFSVVVGMASAKGVVFLHDPEQGPARRLSRATWQRLWEPDSEHCEIRGRVAAVFGTPDRRKVAHRRCSACDRQVPTSFDCRACGRPIPLAPSAVLECPAVGCSGRRWEHLFCPWCDATISAFE